MFLFVIQSRVHMIMETISPPIQTPETVSSTPSQRDTPTPAPTATVQTGQTARADLTGNKKAVKNADVPDMSAFFVIILLKLLKVIDD